MKRLVLAIALLAPSLSFADSGAPPAVLLDAGVSDAGSASSAPAPSSQLHDPASDPAGVLSDVKAARKSWPLLVLVILIGLTKLASYASGKLAFIGKFLSTGKRAMWVAGLGTLAAVAYDALANGGSLYSAGAAVVGSLLALTSSHAPPAAVEKAAVSA